MPEERWGLLIEPTRTAAVRDSRRERFLHLLLRSIQECLRETGLRPREITKVEGTVFIGERDLEPLLSSLRRVFGIALIRIGVLVSHNDRAIARAVRKMLQQKAGASAAGGVVFSLSRDDSTAIVLAQQACSLLSDDGLAARVESSDQPVTGSALNVTLCPVGDDLVFVANTTEEGLGGLPTGMEGRVVIMISSGLDSPVAAYEIIRRGAVPVFVHFDNSPYSDRSNVNVAIEQVRHLCRFIHGVEVKMYIVPHGDDLTEVLRHAPRRMTCVFCRRNMYRLAAEVARRENAEAIVTGEIIGEQASQTTRNLLVETSAISDPPVIRPCIGYDKVEIERMAREIGTYRFASEAASCCVLPPKYPTIHAPIEEIAPAEEKMDLLWIRAEVNEAEVLVLKEGQSL